MPKAKLEELIAELDFPAPSERRRGNRRYDERRKAHKTGRRRYPPRRRAPARQAPP